MTWIDSFYITVNLDTPRFEVSDSDEDYYEGGLGRV